MNSTKYRRLAAVLSVMLAAFLFTQCKKSGGGAGGGNNSGGYYLKFNLNGSPVEYTSDAFATINKVNSYGLYGAVLVAYKDVSAGAKNDVTIILFSAGPIAANTPYNDPDKATETNGSIVPESEVLWDDSTGNAYLTAGAISDANGNTPLSGVTANAQLTITELTASDVKGTFSGTVYRSDFGASESITDGQFYLKRMQ